MQSSLRTKTHGFPEGIKGEFCKTEKNKNKTKLMEAILKTK